MLKKETSVIHSASGELNNQAVVESFYTDNTVFVLSVSPTPVNQPEPSSKLRGRRGSQQGCFSRDGQGGGSWGCGRG